MADDFDDEPIDTTQDIWDNLFGYSSEEDLDFEPDGLDDFLESNVFNPYDYYEIRDWVYLGDGCRWRRRKRGAQ